MNSGGRSKDWAHHDLAHDLTRDLPIVVTTTTTAVTAVDHDPVLGLLIVITTTTIITTTAADLAAAVVMITATDKSNWYRSARTSSMFNADSKLQIIPGNPSQAVCIELQGKWISKALD